METDSFFCQLFKQLPETLFQLIGLPGERALAYRFDSVEIKKSLRIDGLYLPKTADLPLYFVEVQFHKSPKFYANLFAKVFTYLHENDPGQDWRAVAIFECRRMEPTRLEPYEELLRSARVTRIYLEEFAIPTNAPLGLGILRIVTAPKDDVRMLVARLVHKAENEIRDSEMANSVIELLEGLLLRRFTELDREEIRKMFGLQDIRKSKVWQEAHEEGREEGREEGVTRERKTMVQNCLENGMSVKAIAELMKISVKEVRRLSK